ncbi:hypothetical protein LXL04_035898 [Taraxacum kok-saghyz]
MEKWREVRRRKAPPPERHHGRSDDSLLASFFVSNLPGDISRQELWKLCVNIGELSDIYIAGRKDVKGSFFAFVKFANVEKPEDIEVALNGVTCRGRKLVANSAKHPRHVAPKIIKKPVQTKQFHYREAPRDARSFADVAKGMSSVPTPPVKPPLILNAIQEIQNWAGKLVLVGEVKCFDTLCSFPSLLAMDGFDVAEIKYLGGMHVLVKFKSDHAATVFKANKNIWIKWFLWVDLVGKKRTEIREDCMDYGYGAPFMRLEREELHFYCCCNISSGKLCILTAKWNKINEEVDVKITDAIHRIGVFEIDDDWIPFKPFCVGSASDSEDDEEGSDAVSDTWHQDGMDL